MNLRLFTIEEKIRAIDSEIMRVRKASRPHGSSNQRHYEVLKAVADDLRARQELPSGNALGSLTRTMEKMALSKTALGYDQGRMLEVAYVVISKWPVIRQALELYGEESAE